MGNGRFKKISEKINGVKIISIKKIIKSAGRFSLVSVLGAYFLVQNRQVKIDKYKVKVKNLPENFIGKKLLLISDLHKKMYGEHYDNLLNSVEFCKPDYIFFAGDLYSKNEKDMQPKAYLMNRLRELAPTFYVLGNHEIRNMTLCESLCKELKKIGVNVLRNDKARIYINDEFVNVYGTQLPISCYVNRDGSYNNLRKITPYDLDKWLGEPCCEQCNILLSHNPFFFEAYAKWGADLVLSGHCHGGIVRLPFIGGILSPERKFFPKYTKGVYEIPDSKMVLTAGLGKFRLNNPSEIVLITVERQSKNEI